MNPLTIIDKLAGRWLAWRTWKKIESETPEPELVDLRVSRGKGLEIILAHPGVATLAAECVRFLQAHDAPNFVQMDLQPRIDEGQRAVIVTVAYKDGEMPAQQIARLRKELEELREERAEERWDE